jgi:hypothetical protein
MSPKMDWRERQAGDAPARPTGIQGRCHIPTCGFVFFIFILVGFR